MPKVLLSLSRFYPKVGGVERYSEELFSRLAQERGYHVTIVSHDNTDAPRYETYRGMEIYRIRSSRALGEVFSVPHGREWRSFVRRISKSGGFDFVSTQTRFFFSSYLGLRLARSLNIPLIHTEHGGSFVRHPSKVVELGARAYDEVLGRMVLQRANGITAVSRQVADFVLQLSGRRAEVVHNGIDTGYWDPAKARPLPKELEQWIGVRIPMLFMGRFMEAKGWRILLHSVSLLPDRDRQRLAILMAGGGPDEERLRDEIASMGLGRCVNPLGRLSPDQIRDILAVAWYLNPSYSGEGLQTTLLEAAAMNSFILSTDVSGATEVVTSPAIGRIVGQRDIQAFSGELQALLRERPKASGRAAVIKEFSWETVVSQYDAYVQAVLARRP